MRPRGGEGNEVSRLNKLFSSKLEPPELLMGQVHKKVKGEGRAMETHGVSINTSANTTATPVPVGSFVTVQGHSQKIKVEGDGLK